MAPWMSSAAAARRQSAARRRAGALVAGVVVAVTLAALPPLPPASAAARREAGPVQAGELRVDEQGRVRLVVRYRSGVTSRRAAALERAAGATRMTAIPQLDLRVVTVHPGEAGQAVAALEARGDVVEVSFDERVTTAAPPPRIPNDPSWAKQWGLEGVAAPAAWARSTGDPGVVVAVLDTGVRSGHPDLVTNLLPGHNAITGTKDTNDSNGHGTHVAGIVAADSNNTRGVAGVCWSCKILPVKVLDDSGSGWISNVAAGIRWAADHGADVINLSLGSSGACSSTYSSALAYARNRGVAVAAAAGNDGAADPSQPAVCTDAIAVAASTASDTRAAFSNHGDWVDVAAPGTGVHSLYLAPHDYVNLQGTSMATPHVAGLLALARSRDPDLSPAALRAALLSSARPVGSWVRAGRVDADAFLAAAATAATPTWPLAPRQPKAVPAATGNPADGHAQVSWEPPAHAGGAPITAYTVTVGPGGRTVTVAGNVATALVDGLATGTSYRFTVAATNSAGTSTPSTPTAAITVRSAPAAPGQPVAVPGEARATVTWPPPTADGGAPVSAYTVVADPGGRRVTVPAPATSAVVDGLDSGTEYRFTVTATNAVGTSPPSAASAPVSPAHPAVPSAPRLAPASDSGVAGDGITNVAAPTFTGSAPDGAGVELLVAAAVSASGQASASGYVLTASPLPDGVHEVRARADGLPSAASTVTIDTAAPTNVAFLGGPAAGSTHEAGTLPPAPTCTADYGVSGPSSCTVTGYLTTSGPHTLVATAIDRAGNATTITRAYTVTAPSAPPPLETPPWAEGAVPISGDWDGNGTSTPGWYRDGSVWLRNASDAGEPHTTFTFGRRGDHPVVGDWDGDGTDTIGILRDRQWHLRNSHSSGAADVSFTYGRLTAGDHPLAGDWNGDGQDTVGIVRGGDWHLRNANSSGAADLVFRYGRVLSGDIPLVGDWSADGHDSPGIVRGGEWHLRFSNTAGPANLVFRYGRATDVPVAGDWIGGGRVTAGVVRGLDWYLRHSNAAGAADTAFRY